jgi:serine/threonine protein phosphatase 1
MNFFKVILLGQNLWETASLDQRIKQRFTLSKRLTLYDEIYIGHTPVTRIGETEPVQKLVSGI